MATNEEILAARKRLLDWVANVTRPFGQSGSNPYPSSMPGLLADIPMALESPAAIDLGKRGQCWQDVPPDKVKGATIKNKDGIQFGVSPGTASDPEVSLWFITPKEGYFCPRPFPKEEWAKLCRKQVDERFAESLKRHEREFMPLQLGVELYRPYAVEIACETLRMLCALSESGFAGESIIELKKTAATVLNTWLKTFLDDLPDKLKPNRL